MRFFFFRRINGITYMIINKRSAASMIGRFSGLVDIAVHQDQTGAIWQSMKGGKNDFFVFDQCGRLAYYLHNSVTYLGWPYVRYMKSYFHRIIRGWLNVSMLRNNQTPCIMT